MSEHEKMKLDESNFVEVNVGGHDSMLEHERIELDDNDLAEITGGSRDLVIGIPKPQHIVFECRTCGSIKNMDLNAYVVEAYGYHNMAFVGGECCGSNRPIKYHCPQCGSEYVYYSTGTIYCSACQKATGSDGSVTAY